MSPFESLPDKCFWRRSLNQGLLPDDPIFRLSADDKIMTAGSCFARRVSSFLKEKGCKIIIKEDLNINNFKLHENWRFDYERLNKFVDEMRLKYNYGIFSARYDDMYNSAQLSQLLQRCLNKFDPVESIWQRPDGNYVDAFRPKINPDGYTNIKELLADRKYHLSKVLECFLEMDVLIFTFGFTETWRSKKDGAFYPIAPGVVADSFDPNIHELVNLNVKDIVSHFEVFLNNLRKINPKSKIIVTVSPTPIIATAKSDWSVLEANCYTKSTLRSACDEIRKMPNVSYFPSYDLVMAAAYKHHNVFEPDCRTPNHEAIKSVMNIFFNMYFEGKKQIAENIEHKINSAVFEECDNICSQ